MDWGEACGEIFNYKLPADESAESPEANAVEYLSRDHAHTISETTSYPDHGAAAESLRDEEIDKDVIACALEGQRAKNNKKGELTLSYKKTAKNEVEKIDERQGDRKTAVIGLEKQFLFRARSHGVGLVESEFECKSDAGRSTVVINGKLDDNLLLINTTDRLRILANSMRFITEELGCAKPINIADIEKLRYAPRNLS